MAEQTDNATAQTPTADEQANNTGAQAQDSGAGTDTAKTDQATQEKTFTQAEVDAIIARRLKTAVKSELKKMAGEGEGQVSLEELQTQLSEKETRLRNYEARETINDFVADPKNKISVKPTSLRLFTKAVTDELEFEDGKIANLKEAIEKVKSFAPDLFATSTGSINATAGRNAPAAVDFNEQLRQAAGYTPR